MLGFFVGVIKYPTKTIERGGFTFWLTVWEVSVHSLGFTDSQFMMTWNTIAQKLLIVMADRSRKNKRHQDQVQSSKVYP